MSNLAAGVVVVTSWVDGRPWGMTVTAFTSVSDRPPTLLVSLDAASVSAAAIEQEGSFGVSILAADQVDVARRGSRRGASKFLDDLAFELEDEDGPAAGPAVAGALAHLDCVVASRVRVADHTVFIARVRDVEVAPGGDPLVYHGRAYRSIGDACREGGTRSCTS
jgi:flavin reductase (DIM6/NTAB) family NADH-FMN oxidoreductase RutF